MSTILNRYLKINEGKTHFKYKDTYSLKVNRWKQIYHADTTHWRARVAILVSDRADFIVKLTGIKKGIR